VLPKVTVETNANKMIDIIGHIEQTINGDMRDLLSNIAEAVMVANNTVSFEKEGKRAGHDAWKQLSEYTISIKEEQNKIPFQILQDTGKLKRSIAVLSINDKEVTVGTRLEYAPIHQFGGRNEEGRYVPKREFLFWSPDGSDQQQVVKSFNAYIQQIIKEMEGK